MTPRVVTPKTMKPSAFETLQKKITIVQNLYFKYQISKRTLSVCKRIVMDCVLPKAEEALTQKARGMLDGLVDVLRSLRAEEAKVPVSAVAKLVRMSALTYFFLGDYTACLARLQAMALFWPQPGKLKERPDLHTHAIDQYEWGCALMKLKRFQECKAPLLRSLRVWLVQLRSTPTQPGLIYVRLGLGHACQVTGEVEKSIGYFNCSRMGLATRREQGLDDDKVSAAVRATNGLRLADAYHACGRHAEALPLYSRYLNARVGSGGPLDFFVMLVGATTTLLQRLYGFLTHAVESATHTGDVNQVVYFNRKLVTICTNSRVWDGSLSVEADEVLEAAALSLDRHKKHLEASTLFLRTIGYRSRRLGDTHETMALAHHNLAVTYESLYREAKGKMRTKWLRKALASYEEVFRIEQLHYPPDDTNIIESKENMSDVLHNLQQYDRAIGYMKEAIAAIRATEPSSPARDFRLARRCRKLGQSLGARGDKWAGIGAATRALEHERAGHQAAGTGVGEFRDYETSYSRPAGCAWTWRTRTRTRRRSFSSTAGRHRAVRCGPDHPAPRPAAQLLVMKGNAHHYMATIDKKGGPHADGGGGGRAGLKFVQHHVKLLVHVLSAR